MRGLKLIKKSLDWSINPEQTCTSLKANKNSSECWMKKLKRVGITVLKKRISPSIGSPTRTRSYYCVNRLHPSWNLCQGRFSSLNSKRRPFHIVCPIKLQCFLMNLQRNIAKHKHTHTKKTVLELSLLLLVKTRCNFSLLSCPSMQQNSAAKFCSKYAAKFCSSPEKILLVFWCSPACFL